MEPGRAERAWKLAALFCAYVLVNGVLRVLMVDGSFGSGLMFGLKSGAVSVVLIVIYTRWTGRSVFSWR
jgi:hypothetical protein